MPPKKKSCGKSKDIVKIAPTSFNAILRKERIAIKEKVSKVGDVEDCRDALLKDLESLDDSPVTFRKRKDIEKNLQVLNRIISKVKTGEIEEAFEKRIAPFAHEYVKRKEEMDLIKRKRKDALTDNLPQVKRKCKTTVGFSDFDKQVVGIGTHAQGEKDPTTITDEMLVELGDDSAKLYMNPYDICEDCDVPMEIAISRPLLICPKCSNNRPFLDVTQASMGFGRNVEFNKFNYQRNGHFSVVLSKVQAKKQVELPQDLIEEIMFHLAQSRIKPEDVKISHIHDIIHDLKFDDYYHFEPQIESYILNKPPLLLSPTQNEKLTIMFKALQEPFETAPNKNRHNMIAYNYCMHKMVQLLGYNYLLDHFPLLKGLKNLKKHDVIWEHICKELDWEFRRSR